MASPARPLVLASTSRYRAAQLERLGIAFEAIAPRYEEDPDLDPDPSRLVLAHAEGKARSLETIRPEAIVVGADQVAALDRSILTKPGGFEAARDQLRRLAGRPHQLHTALAVLDPGRGRCLTHLETTTLTMRPLSETEIEGYLVRDEPYDCAGSYRFESLGAALFDSVEGNDPTAIEGMPLLVLTRILREFGIAAF